tara:strand:- start:4496 stop:4960 length:465 start_codon:yes stop_codon:yes gene_type:complete
MKKILFLHGLESMPGGSKPRFLQKHGYVVLNPKLPKSSFKESTKISQDLIDSEKPCLIVGSSRGGAIAMACNPRGIGMVLIAPAWKRFGINKDIGDNGSILHCENDQIVNYDDSVQLSNHNDMNLIKCGKCHRMNDPDALDALLDVTKWYIGNP